MEEGQDSRIEDLKPVPQLGQYTHPPLNPQAATFANIAALQLSRASAHAPTHLQIPQDLAYHAEHHPAALQALLHPGIVPSHLQHDPAPSYAHPSHAFMQPDHAMHSPSRASLQPPELSPASTQPAPRGSEPPPSPSEGNHISHMHRSAPPATPSGRTVFSGTLSLEKLREIQAQFANERDWEKFHTPRNLVLALVGEVGELAELFQWRGDAGATYGLPGFSPEQKKDVENEISDVLLYLVRLAETCGVDLSSAVIAKIEQNSRKYPADRVRGSSKKYTAYPQEAAPRVAPTMAASSMPPAAAIQHAVPALQQAAAQHAVQQAARLAAAEVAVAAASQQVQQSTVLHGEPMDRSRSDSKRKRFSEAQVAALGRLAESAHWRLQNVPKATREQFCTEWDISQERLHNFINNRKPKDLKKPRTTRPSTGSGGSLDVGQENGQQGDYSHDSPEPEASQGADADTDHHDEHMDMHNGHGVDHGESLRQSDSGGVR